MLTCNPPNTLRLTKKELLATVRHAAICLVFFYEEDHVISWFVSETMSAIVRERPDITIISLEKANNEVVATALDATRLPTVIIFIRGLRVGSTKGDVSKDRVLDWINEKEAAITAAKSTT